MADRDVALGRLDQGREQSSARTGLLSKIGIAGLFVVCWFALIGYFAVADAWSVVSFGSVIAVDPDKAGFKFNLAVLGFTTGVSLVVGMVRPGWWRRVMLLLAVLPGPLFMVTSNTVPAGVAALALLLPTVCLSRQVVSALYGDVDRVGAWAIACALGIATVAYLGFVLGLVGLLRSPVVWTALLLLTVTVVATGRRTIRADLSSALSWMNSPIRRRPAYLVLSGIMVAFVWLNMGGVVAPELTADSAFHRLVVASEFAKTGRLSTDVDLGAARSPAGGEVLYAVALVNGPVQTAKVFHFTAGLVCCLSLLAINRRFGDPEHAGVPAVAFYATAMVAWLSQVAYLDLLTSMFAIAAGLAIVLPEKPNWRSAVIAGIFIAMGVVVKVHFAYVAIGLAVLAALWAFRSRGVFGAARLVAVLTIVSLLVAAPWLIRSLIVAPNSFLGARPGVQMLLQAQPTADLNTFGYGRSHWDLIRLPYDFFFRNGVFGSHVRSGSIGYLVPALLGTLVVARSRRPALVVLVGAVTALLFWFYTAQYLRYGLPVFAMVCSAAGIAYASAMTKVSNAPIRGAVSVLLVSLAVAGAMVEVKEPLFNRDLVFGRVTEAEYLQVYLRGYGVMEKLKSEPNASRALVSTAFARLYSPIPFSHVGNSGRPVARATSEEQTLAELDAGGYSHIVIDREALPANWASIVAFDDQFLERYTEIAAVDFNVITRSYIYLYRIIPPAQRSSAHRWAQGPNLLVNGGFEAARGNSPITWTAYNTPAYDRSPGDGRDGVAAVRVSLTDTFSSPATVDEETDYILSLWAHSTQKDARASFLINWLDENGGLIKSTVEVTPPVPPGYRQFSMLTQSPPGAATAVVFAQAQVGEVWLDNFSLRSVPPAKRLPNDENLLLDADFSGFLSRTSFAWKHFAPPGGPSAWVDRQPDNTIVAHAWPESGFWQTVPVDGGRSYRLSFKAWSADPQALARIQINWITLSHAPHSATISGAEVGDQPIEISRWMKAPEGAAYAVVYTGVHSGGPVSFSDYALQAEATQPTSEGP